MPVVPKRRTVWFLITAVLAGTGVGLPRALCAEAVLTPETDLYFTHNNIFRSRIIANSSWSGANSQWSSGFFEYTVDFGLKSFFRRYVYKDPNAEKNKFFTVRLGYAYLPDYHKGDAESDEKRGVAELTMRLPIGGQWLWSDRNKGDFRQIGDDSSVRYRNRLKVERSMAFLGFKGTPYAATEGYYDTSVSRWNRLEATVGMEFPWKYSTVLELTYTHQENWQGSPKELFGFILQKHMAMPIGGTQ